MISAGPKFHADELVDTPDPNVRLGLCLRLRIQQNELEADFAQHQNVLCYPNCVTAGPRLQAYRHAGPQCALGQGACL
jgi:hypothetical protein